MRFFFENQNGTAECGHELSQEVLRRENRRRRAKPRNGTYKQCGQESFGTWTNEPFKSQLNLDR